MLIREEMNELPCLMPRWLPYHIKSEINSVHKQFSSCWYSTPSTAAAAVVDGWWQSPPKDPQLLTGGEISISTEEAIVYLAGLWMKETRWLPIHPPRWPLTGGLPLSLPGLPGQEMMVKLMWVTVCARAPKRILCHCRLSSCGLFSPWVPYITRWRLR